MSFPGPLSGQTQIALARLRNNDVNIIDYKLIALQMESNIRERD
jgi:hypothetical protein